MPTLSSVRTTVVSALLLGQLTFAFTIDETFTSWAYSQNRQYASEAERTLRLSAFAANMARMQDLQKLSPLAHYAPDEFSDWTVVEKKGLTGLNLTRLGRGPDPTITFSNETVQKAIAAGDLDWVKKGAVTPPTSQGRCATCQDFSAAADIEGAW
jgi:hypothetical protein